MTDLKVAQVGHTVTLSFTAPKLAMDGRRLNKPIEVKIFREAGPHGPALPEAMAAQKPWVVILPKELTRFDHGGEIKYSDRLSPAEFARSTGSLHVFIVLTLTRGFRGHPRKSAPSNIAKMRILQVTPPINDLRAVETRGAIDLRWSAPRESFNGTSKPALEGYRIYRAELPGVSAFVLVASTRQPRYQDTHFQFETAYSYKVRAVFAEGGYTAETADSSQVRITPRPVFPPPPPVGLTAVFTGKAVQLIWKPATESGIAGYNVYRQERGAPAQRLNKQLLQIPVYTDPAISAGSAYFYWVTAVDQEHNESKPSSVAGVKTQ